MRELTFTDLTRNMEASQAESFMDFIVDSHTDTYNFKKKSKKRKYKVSALDKCDVEACRSILAKYL